jgi:hypothetical protein
VIPTRLFVDPLDNRYVATLVPHERRGTAASPRTSAQS